MNIILSGKIAMSVMLLFTSIGHFKFTNGMAMMMPERMPAKKEMILITGVIEILAAIGILISSTAKLTGILLIIFFVLILPSNVSAAIRHVNYEKADYTGKGTEYLWFRIPFQLLLIGWVYFFIIR
jgi:uncharacterized membrane protein